MRTLSKLTMGNLINQSVDLYKGKSCLRTYNKDDSLTYEDMKDRVKRIGASLRDLKIGKNDKVAIFSHSQRNWGLAYLAITSIGATAVVILSEFESQQAMEMLQHSNSKAVFVSQSNYPKIKGLNLLFFNLDKLCHVPGHLLKVDEDFGQGTSLITDRSITDFELASLSSEDDVASIIYTSGTTARSKGVELTHRNLLWNAVNSTAGVFRLHSGLTFLSILPMAHAYEFTIGFLVPLLWGCEIVYLGRKLTTPVLLDAMRTVRPHVMLSVPLLIEKIVRKAVLPKLNPKLQKMLNTPVLRAFVYKAIGRQLLSKFGSRLRFFGLGGAAIDPEIAEFLDKVGFPYAIGYGLTETSPYIAGCGVHDHVKGTIGRIVKGLDAKILESGELVVKGPSVMKGYYNEEELTKEAFTSDGYFRTGDLCEIVDGRLVLKGRLKDVILSSSGENVYPEAIESLINACDSIEESLVIPQDNALVALIRVDLESYAANLAISLKDAKDQVLEYLGTIKNTVNQKLPSFSRINSVKLVLKPFERTPTMKIKRYKIENEYKKAN